MRLTLFSLLLLLANTGVRDCRSAPGPDKSVVEYVKFIPGHAFHLTLYHFQELNTELARFAANKRGLNTKCLVVPDMTGYAVVWIRSDWEEPVSGVQKKKAESIIQSYLLGKDSARITKELKQTRK